MTSQQAIDKFAVLQDLRSSPNFDDDEVLQFLNMAQLERLRRIIPDDRGNQTNFEFDQNTQAVISKLIYTVSAVTNSSGVLLFSELNSDVADASGQVGATIHRIISVGMVSNSDVFPVKFARSNDIFRMNQNFFKRPSSNNPTYTIEIGDTSGRYLRLWNQSGITSLVVTAIKTPLAMTVGNTPEWEDDQMNEIINIALQYAQVASRDNELLGSIQNANISK